MARTVVQEASRVVKVLQQVVRCLCVASLAVAVGALAASPVQAKDCGRACLSGLVTQYLDALIAHEPTKLPLSPDVRFTEDSRELEPGEGLWRAGPGCRLGECGTYRQRIMVHPSILPSVAVVDEEPGIVVLWMNFGYTDSYGPGNALVAFEAFKIRAGEIHSINAFFRPLPISAPRAWPSADPLPRR